MGHHRTTVKLPYVLCYFGLIDLPLQPTYSRMSVSVVLYKSHINVDLIYDFLMQM